MELEPNASAIAHHLAMIVEPMERQGQEMLTPENLSRLPLLAQRSVDALHRIGVDLMSPSAADRVLHPYRVTLQNARSAALSGDMNMLRRRLSAWIEFARPYPAAEGGEPPPPTPDRPDWYGEILTLLTTPPDTEAETVVAILSEIGDEAILQHLLDRGLSFEDVDRVFDWDWSDVSDRFMDAIAEERDEAQTEAIRAAEAALSNWTRYL